MYADARRHVGAHPILFPVVPFSAMTFRRCTALQHVNIDCLVYVTSLPGTALLAYNEKNEKCIHLRVVPTDQEVLQVSLPCALTVTTLLPQMPLPGVRRESAGGFDIVLCTSRLVTKIRTDVYKDAEYS